jgi:hypothetical protein
MDKPRFINVSRSLRDPIVLLEVLPFTDVVRPVLDQGSLFADLLIAFEALDPGRGVPITSV